MWRAVYAWFESSSDTHRWAARWCGKRGGAPILKGIEQKLGSKQKFDAVYLKKSSAHSVASKKLIDEIVETCDAVVYGVVN